MSCTPQKIIETSVYMTEYLNVLESYIDINIDKRIGHLRGLCFLHHRRALVIHQFFVFILFWRCRRISVLLSCASPLEEEEEEESLGIADHSSGILRRCH